MSEESYIENARHIIASVLANYLFSAGRDGARPFLHAEIEGRKFYICWGGDRERLRVRANSSKMVWIDEIERAIYAVEDRPQVGSPLSKLLHVGPALPNIDAAIDARYNVLMSIMTNTAKRAA